MYESQIKGLLEQPGHFYELAPISVLIGTIYAMARLAQSSEFTILRTGGLGPGRALRRYLLSWIWLLPPLALGQLLALQGGALGLGAVDGLVLGDDAGLEAERLHRCVGAVRLDDGAVGLVAVRTGAPHVGGLDGVLDRRREGLVAVVAKALPPVKRRRPVHGVFDQCTQKDRMLWRAPWCAKADRP